MLTHTYNQSHAHNHQPNTSTLSSINHCPAPALRRLLPLFPSSVQVGISLILSFMVVWDLPTIKRGVQSLRTSRIAPIYNTVAPSLEIFATLFGKALQAQVRAVGWWLDACSS